MMPSKQFNIGDNKRFIVPSSPMSLNKHEFNVRKDYHMSVPDHDTYHKLDDFDNPNSWNLQELDMMEGMGFQIEGDCRMGLAIPGDMEMNKYEVAKHKKLGYELRINERKHYFKSFDKMMDKIDEFGKLDV